MALAELQKDSGKWIKSSVLVGLTKSMTSNPCKLQSYTRADSSSLNFQHLPTYPLSGKDAVLASHSKVVTLSRGRDGNITALLNTSLLGGTNYPILEFALTTAIGFYSSGMGLLFSVGGTALSMSRTAQRILAREGDEIWLVEQIGKSGGKTVHVAAYFLFDPYRNTSFSGANGWLIHEERQELDVV